MAKKQRAGRKTKMPADAVRRVIIYAGSGFTIAQIAAAFSVHRDTIYEWKEKHPEFSDALENGRDRVVSQVFGAQVKAAIGHTVPTVEVKVVSDGRGMGSSIQKVKVKKYYPPDTKAGQFILTNLRPKDFKNKSDVDVTTQGQALNDGMDLSKLTDEEIATLAALEAKARKSNNDGTTTTPSQSDTASEEQPAS